MGQWGLHNSYDFKENIIVKSISHARSTQGNINMMAYVPVYVGICRHGTCSMFIYCNRSIYQP